MKKSEPKMILNLSVENSELEEKIKIAMDKYTEDLIRKDLDDVVAKYVEERITRLLKGNRYSWDNGCKIQGMYFSEFVKNKTEQAIADVIEKNAKDILAKKLASLL